MDEHQMEKQLILVGHRHLLPLMDLWTSGLRLHTMMHVLGSGDLDPQHDLLVTSLTEVEEMLQEGRAAIWC